MELPRSKSQEDQITELQYRAVQSLDNSINKLSEHINYTNQIDKIENVAPMAVLAKLLKEVRYISSLVFGLTFPQELSSFTYKPPSVDPPTTEPERAKFIVVNVLYFGLSSMRTLQSQITVTWDLPSLVTLTKKAQTLGKIIYGD
jgi:hypothetical protein